MLKKRSLKDQSISHAIIFSTGDGILDKNTRAKGTASFFRSNLSKSSILNLCIIVATFWFSSISRAKFLSNSKSDKVSLVKYSEKGFSEEAKSNLLESDLESKRDYENPQAISLSATNLRGSSGTTNTTITTTIASSQSSLTWGVKKDSFTRYDGVAIVTKVLWVKDLQKLKKWTCMINSAYNDRMKYDFIIFTTMPWEPEDVEKLQKVAYPAKLTVALEAPPLEEQIAAMTKEEVKFLYDRCNVKENETITWFHYCSEPGSRHVTNLGYSWQAEFRAYHIWKHPALKDYKYMMWIDADAGIGRKWDVDPMKAMVENNLTILYAGWPYGSVRNSESLREKLVNTYNTSICQIDKGQDVSGISHIYARTCTDKHATIIQIAGNHHITNLDVYRKDIHQNFLKEFTGDHRFSRLSDDQMAVTIVGLMEQYLVNNRTDIPKKFTVWHERSHELVLKIAHHKMYDVIKAEKAPKRLDVLYNTVKSNFTGLEERCEAVFAGKL